MRPRWQGVRLQGREEFYLLHWFCLYFPEWVYRRGGGGQECNSELSLLLERACAGAHGELQLKAVPSYADFMLCDAIWRLCQMIGHSTGGDCISTRMALPRFQPSLH